MRFEDQVCESRVKLKWIRVGEAQVGLVEVIGYGLKLREWVVDMYLGK